MQVPSADNSFKTEEIDVREMALVLLKNKWWILAASILFFSVSAFYAFFIARPVYESSALLLPTQTGGNSELSAVAFLGKRSGGGTGDAELYQGLLTSRTVTQKVLLEKIINESDTGKGKLQSIAEILGVDTSAPGALAGAAEGISNSVFVGSRATSGGGILEVKVSAETPWLAQHIGDIVLQIGQEQLRLVRIERSNVVMSRLLIAVNMARSEWDSAARALAWYRDRNRSIVLPDQMLAIARLEIEKQAKEQKYLMARREYENQMLDQAKAAPPMMILDPSSRPYSKLKPKRTLIMAIGFVFGATFASGLILLFSVLFRKEVIQSEERR